MSDTADGSSDIYFATEADGSTRPLTEEERKLIDKYRFELGRPAAVGKPVDDPRFPRKPWRPGG